MHLLPFNSHKHLPYLVCLGLAMIILNVYARVSLPWCSVYTVAAAAVTGFPEIKIADLAQLSKPNVFRIVF